MSEAGEAPTGRDVRTAELLDRVAELEHRLDPEPVRSGQRIADLVTLVILTLLVVWVGEGLRYPLLLLVLLMGARTLGRLLVSSREHRTREDRDRLLAIPDRERIQPGGSA